jgi:hypothetical protein
VQRRKRQKLMNKLSINMVRPINKEFGPAHGKGRRWLAR